MIKLATAAAVAALLGVSASASAFWGGGPWGGSPWGGGNDWSNDMMGDGSGDFNKNKSRGGRGFGRGHHRYRDYSGYGPYGGPGAAAMALPTTAVAILTPRLTPLRLPRRFRPRPSRGILPI